MKILDQTIRAEDIEVQLEGYYIRGLLCGGSGSGKTTSALSLPGRKLLIDLDGRSRAAGGFANTEILPLAEIYGKDPKGPELWMKLMGIKKELWTLTLKDFPYDAIILDGLTAMNRLSMNWALLLDPHRGLGGTPGQVHYGPAMGSIVDMVQGMKSLPCHFLLTCHLELLEDSAVGSYRLLPKTWGKLRTDVESWFDETYLCQRDHGKGGETEYSWMTAGGGKYRFLKSTLNHLGEYWKDPFKIVVPKDTSGASPWGFQRLLEMRFGKEKKETKP